MKAFRFVCTLVALVVALAAAPLPAVFASDEDPAPAAEKTEGLPPAAAAPLASVQPLYGPGEKPYRLGAGDVLSISVWRDESLTREVVVPPDGVVSFQLVGDVRASGLTVSELREQLKAKLAPFVPDAPVAVLLNRPESMTASVIGKVGRPGQFPINVETRALQLLAAAGGLTPYASASKILILRQEKGGTVKLAFDYDDVKSGKRLEQNVLLERGDVIVVP